MSRRQLSIGVRIFLFYGLLVSGAFAATESEVVTSPGEAVVVSGLVETLKSRFREKTPLLGDIPLLKCFFGSTRESGDSTRLLVVVVPHRASGAPAKEKPFSEGAGKTLEDARQGP